MKAVASTAFSAAMALIIVVLLTPVLLSLINPPRDPIKASSMAVKAILISFLVSLLPLTLLVLLGADAVNNSWSWLGISSFTINLSFKFDFYSATFTPIALFVSWSIMQFTTWYMHSDPQIARFTKYLLIFLTSMLILVSANNMFLLFIGWEGVGIMSFLLIGWWFGRADANTAAMQAMLYNRAGDIGVLLSMVWLSTTLNSLETQNAFITTDSAAITLPLVGLILGATGKSAQFGLHPWLPAAMEGPTPVSALLHSSTMVVAGIFLLIRLSPMMESNTTALTICLWLGSLTALINAFFALVQNDIKKIVAFSTSSQLGLMMVTIGLNQPELAFMHICTHAFFKALLFLCSGSIIHALNNEQDIRKMGGVQHHMPVTTSALGVASLALTGTPFLTGFYSKDAIIEALDTSYLNTWALIITLIATSFTAVYSMRIYTFVVAGSPRNEAFPPIDEKSHNLIQPITRLAVGSTFAGFFLSSYILPTKTPVLTMPLFIKISALGVTVLGLLVALELARLASGHLQPTSKPTLYTFSSLTGFVPAVLHRLIPNLSFLVARAVASQTIDQAWLEKVGPKAIEFNTKQLATSASHMQRGLVKLYLVSFIITLVIALVLAYALTAM
uniref:NADH-ubiquinone oxidoreductase chain 5 n=1 Tax=Carapus dubius TaxID=2923460 RepID=A0AA95Z401_9TELE|nr:NADH dehydrogenase subunit 5 [Carapus dubius]